MKQCVLTARLESHHGVSEQKRVDRDSGVRHVAQLSGHLGDGLLGEALLDRRRAVLSEEHELQLGPNDLRQVLDEVIVEQVLPSVHVQLDQLGVRAELQKELLRRLESVEGELHAEIGRRHDAIVTDRYHQVLEKNLESLGLVSVRVHRPAGLVMTQVLGSPRGDLCKMRNSRGVKPRGHRGCAEVRRWPTSCFSGKLVERDLV